MIPQQSISILIYTSSCDIFGSLAYLCHTEQTGQYAVLCRDFCLFTTLADSHDLGWDRVVTHYIHNPITKRTG